MRRSMPLMPWPRAAATMMVDIQAELTSSLPWSTVHSG